MKEMINKYKCTLICSAFVLFVATLVGFFKAESKEINVFFVAIYCVLVAIVFWDNRKRQQSHKIMRLVLWIIPAIAVLHNIIVRLVCMDVNMDNLYVALTYYGTGILFVVVGNYLPKVKPNHTIGIRVIWALQDEENWVATHRFSGRVWMTAGVLCMLCGLFGETTAALILYVVIIGAAAIISVLYSYLFYKKKITK